MAVSLVIPTFSDKEPIADDTEFTIYTSVVTFDPTKAMTFVHMDVYRWSPSVWRRIQSTWLSIRRLLPPIVYSCGDVCDAKWCKFVERLGFEPVLQDCPCSDGTLRPIYAHFNYERRN